ncbi:hypothetical protein [Agriterribacter sp.]|uniref:hypothetical protein n=1 Tax=Agriterribacter sp. TaxID=2821509 RepID=UPI002C8D313A|nr:hypothetical protein [Agriterribacter sp.]HTN09238.1 hypothetical protein [Agriterribacter sp.]
MGNTVDDYSKNSSIDDKNYYRPSQLPIQLVEFIPTEVLKELHHCDIIFTPEVLEQYVLNYYLRLPLNDISQFEVALTKREEAYTGNKKDFYADELEDFKRNVHEKSKLDPVTSAPYKLGLLLQACNLSKETIQIIIKISESYLEENEIAKRIDTPIQNTTDLVNIVLNSTFPSNPRTFWGAPIEYRETLSIINQIKITLDGYCDGAILDFLKKRAKGGYTHRVHIFARQYQEQCNHSLPIKGSTDWKNERGQKAKSEYYTTLTGNKKKYKPETEAELLALVQFLKDFPHAQDIAKTKLKDFREKQ